MQAGSNDIERAQPLYDDEYENEEPTSYQPENVDIPIVVEESQGVTVDLPSYDPVVLLVGTPVQVRVFIKAQFFPKQASRHDLSPTGTV